MQNEKDLIEKENEEIPETENEAPETAEHHVPGIEYKDEPDAENIMPAKDRPGTL
jgi:hypothetical protein